MLLLYKVIPGWIIQVHDSNVSPLSHIYDKIMQPDWRLTIDGYYSTLCKNIIIWIEANTVKPVNKGHPRERQRMVFMDKWPSFGGYIVLFNHGRITEMCPLFTG